MRENSAAAGTGPPRRRTGLLELVLLGARQVVGLALGAMTGVAALAWLLVSALGTVVALPWPPAFRAARRLSAAGVSALVRVELRRLAYWLDCDIMPAHGGGRQLGYLACRSLLGPVIGYLLWMSVFTAALFLVGAALTSMRGDPSMITIELLWVGAYIDPRTLGATLGLVTLALTILGVSLMSAVERWLARWFLGPSLQDRLRHRISELTESRAGVVHAVDDERRRIERDLHDGVQQRVVALAMLLGRARRSGDATQRAGELLRQAHEESQQLVGEIRDVAWRVYPRALDEHGLRSALASMAERAGIAVTVEDDRTERPASEVETAVYFLAREAVTNAVKHAEATEVRVVLSECADADTATGSLTVRVTDNGKGGAVPSGGGLSGLGRRVSALDGELRVDSPPGGPTTITATLPRHGARPASPRENGPAT
ncbi:signal transduction histidine kinase [Lipingzhangella halophila]|uniref:histidine kinase n=1 Tax=Lipingzhangella halophila TaxID=1783352 RepID=A0A7W7RM34_9ACTN|nr:histidine kinase [Lipingzhangella halophila]MBB4934282.1 signal transduction histidine kinase [Lipingzhangella halophila]